MNYLSKPVQHYYGKHFAFSTDCNETQCNNNVLVMGGSGSGKTVSVMEMELLQNVERKASMVVHISKTRLYEKYKPLFEEHGFQVEYMDFADPSQNTVAFDPLMFLEAEDDYSNAMNLAKNIVECEGNLGNEDPYWDYASESLLIAEMMTCIGTDPRATMKDVVEFHQRILPQKDTQDNLLTDVDKVFERIEMTEPLHKILPYWNTFRKNSCTTALCIYSSLTTPLNNMFSPGYLGRMTEVPLVDVRALADEPTVLFVYTSPVKRESHALANLFANYVIKNLYEYAESCPGHTLPREVNYVFDDFACGARVADFERYIAIFREKGISTTLLIQDQAQLNCLYGDEAATTIMNNCDTQIYLGGMDLLSNENYARRMNCPPEDVSNMPIGQELLFRRGEPKPYRTERYNTPDNPVYQALEEMMRRKEQNDENTIRKATGAFSKFAS